MRGGVGVELDLSNGKCLSGVPKVFPYMRFSIFWKFRQIRGVHDVIMINEHAFFPSLNEHFLTRHFGFVNG